LWIQLRYPKRETFSRERRRNAQTAQCMQASNSSSQWAQIHGHLFPSTNILFNMPRVHLVSTIWVLGCTMGNFYVSISIRVWILKVQTYFTNLQVFKKCNEFLLVTVKCIACGVTMSCMWYFLVISTFVGQLIFIESFMYPTLCTVMLYGTLWLPVVDLLCHTVFFVIEQSSTFNNRYLFTLDFFFSMYVCFVLSLMNSSSH